MPAGKTRAFPAPGTHAKCKACPIHLVCVSGRRAGERFWCNTCRGPYHETLGVIVRCVVFRQKRGRYSDRRYGCPVCAATIWQDTLDEREEKTIEGVTHQDAVRWRSKQNAR